MKARLHPWLATVAAATLAVTAVVGASPVAAANPNHPGSNRWILVAKGDQDVGGLRADILVAGGRILNEIPDLDTFVVTGGTGIRNLASDSHASAVAADHVEQIVPPESAGSKVSPLGLHKPYGGSHSKVTPDPAFSLSGLMWNVNRINAPQAWKTTTGSPAVTVGVADTGLDYTNSELATQVAGVVDFTGMEGTPTICEQVYGTGLTDAYWAAKYNGPATTDWNGHGSWIGGNIAAALDGMGINGIAPGVKLVALKISQWCGYAYDSEILAAFAYAAKKGIDVVSISFGGYLDLTVPDQATIYQQYVKTVAYALRKGTLIVAAAGNEHARIGAGGRVLSHGILWTPGDTPSAANPVDYYGLYETPGGIPGVIDVSATGNVVNKPTSGCTYPDKLGITTDCKSKTDAHQPFGVGRYNQLAYYSNYGPRIDIAAPGGARKFNLPAWDVGGTPGWPVTTADGYSAWEDFSITSNWALEIDCYYDIGPQFYPDDCYSTIQGTSMATPHVSAVAALYASAYPWLRHNPSALVFALKSNAQHISGNTTPPLSAADTSGADLPVSAWPSSTTYGTTCPTGYCHLGGKAISDSDAYGAGLVNASVFGH